MHLIICFGGTQHRPCPFNVIKLRCVHFSKRNRNYKEVEKKKKKHSRPYHPESMTTNTLVYIIIFQNVYVFLNF